MILSPALGRIRRDLPIYVVAGSRDPVGGNGSQVKSWIKLARGLGLAVDDRMWIDGRHEMLNEVERDAVTADVMGWIDRQLATLTA